MFDFTTLPWKEIILVIATAAVTTAIGGIAYLLKRRIEGASIASRLERHGRVLAIHKELKNEGMTVSDLDRLEGELTKRRRAAHEMEEHVAAELAAQRAIADGPARGQSQAAMNIIAGADLNTSRAILARALVELEMHGSSELLAAAQRSWEAYAEAEARYRASTVAGGTMYPLIYASDLERLTVTRTADLREHMEWLKRL